MEAAYRTGNGKLTFKLSGEDVKSIFKQISSVQEVFDSELKCGCCGGTDLRYLARKVEDFDFYELACQAHECRARFSFGQAKKGGALFPRRKDEDGKWLPNGGWSKYQKDGDAGKRDSGAVRENGVPVYATWDDAQRDDSNWGSDWVKVAGELFKLVDGHYIKNAVAAPK